MRSTRSTPLLVALAALLTSVLLLLAAPGSASAVWFDGIAARINSDIITLHDVRQATTPFLIQRSIDPDALNDPTQRATIYKDVLDDLIERKLLVQEANKLSIVISDEELDQWLGFTRQEQGLTEAQFKEAIEGYGMSYEDYREMTRDNLLRLRISRLRVGSKVSISEAEVEAAYRLRYGAMARGERYLTISHILFQPATNSPQDLEAALNRAQAAFKRLDQGDAFADVAEEDSDGPSAKAKGVLGTFRRGELDPEFEEAAFKLSEGERSPLVKTKFGYHIILVSRVEDRPNPDVEDRKDELRGELRQRAMERQLKSYVQGLRTRAFVKVNL